MAKLAPPDRDHIAFAMNLLAVPDDCSLAPGHVLRKANAAEADQIKEILRWASPDRGTGHILPWECSLPFTGSRRRLPRAEWRYHVLAFRDSSTTLSDLENAFLLAPLEVEVGFTVTQHTIGYSVQYEADRLFHFLSALDVDQAYIVKLSPSAADDIRSLYDALQHHDHSHLDLHWPVVQLSLLKGQPYASSLRFLGYFALLESLLTHQPRESDPYDSITRQVKTKIALLNNRWIPPLDYSAFGKTEPARVWGAMYGYRSLVAHGGRANFKGDQKLLRDHDTALRLVRDTVKATIRHALLEPQLLVDLKNC